MTFHATLMADEDGDAITSVTDIPDPLVVVVKYLGGEMPIDKVYPESITDPEIRNQYRAALAGPAVRQYSYLCGGEGIETTVQDMLTDLMHLCDATDVDFDDALGSAVNRYNEEIAGE